MRVVVYVDGMGLEMALGFVVGKGGGGGRAGGWVSVGCVWVGRWTYGTVGEG